MNEKINSPVPGKIYEILDLIVFSYSIPHAIFLKESEQHYHFLEGKKRIKVMKSFFESGRLRLTMNEK